MSISKDKQKKIEFYLQKIESVPSLPAVVTQIIKLIDNPMTSTGQIEDLMMRDQGISLKALRLANSAYYAVPGGAKTITRAITFLGFNSIKQLVLSSTVFDSFKKLDSPPIFSMIEFWKHSMGTAIVAEKIARYLKISSPEEVFMCGLCHDLGKPALLMIDKDSFLTICTAAKNKNITFYQSELESDVPLHTYLGHLLAKKWRLPDLMLYTIKDHHSVSPNLRSTTDPEINRIIDVVYIANQVVHYLNYGNSGYENKTEVNAEVLSRLGLKLSESEEWLAIVREAILHADSMVHDLVST